MIAIPAWVWILVWVCLLVVVGTIVAVGLCSGGRGKDGEL
jgi:hypothetical protein